MSFHKVFLVSFLALSVVSVSVTDAGRFRRVLQGTNARPGELKYQVSIRRGEFHTCGGTLISNRHVLTAAHCFVGKVEPPYTEGYVFTTGMTKLSEGGEEHFAKSVTVHPKYVKGNSKNRWRHDIAVVTLATPANTTPLQAPIALASTNLTESVKGTLSGWGQVERGIYGEYPDELKKSTVTIITLDACRERNKPLETHICGFDGAQTGFCSGDSGGPLVYNREIVGVVSFAASCGLGFPDLYTRVYAYRDFIRGVMEQS